ERVFGRQFVQNANAVLTRGVGEHSRRPVASRIEREAKRFLQPRSVEGGGEMSLVVMHALQFWTGPKIMPEIVANPVAEVVIGNPGGDHKINVLESDIG